MIIGAVNSVRGADFGYISTSHDQGKDYGDIQTGWDLIGDPIYDVYSDPTSSDDENETQIVEEGNNSSSSHSIFGDHRIVGTRQQHDMVVPDSSMVSPMSLKVYMDDENRENIGPQDEQVSLQQIVSENEGQFSILSESENKSDFGDSTNCVC
jgi:hypothetical protein